jgi:hypothetical protein
MMMYELGASTSHDERFTDPLSGAAHAANAIETALVMDTLKKACKNERKGKSQDLKFASPKS